jgi:NAD(P)H-nitrite reductase large subunit
LTYLIIGNSAAGLAAAEAIRRYDGETPVTLVSDEGERAYSRVVLSWLVKDAIPEPALFFKRPEYYDRLNLTVIEHERIVRVYPDAKRVLAKSGRSYPYRRLLIATGSTANHLDVPGSSLEGIHVLRCLDDAREIRARVARSRSALVAGGGLVGLKCADALAHHGMRVLMLVSSGQILSQVLNREASQIARQRLESVGVEIRCHTSIEDFVGEGGQVAGACLSDGTLEPCDLVIIGKGVTPNTDLVRGTGVALGHGIQVNERQQTSLPEIFAAGDVAESYDAISGERGICANWPVAVAQGRVAGANIAGGDESYAGNVRANVFEVGGTSFASAGHIRPQSEDCVFSRGPDRRGWGTWLYRRQGRLVGATLVGDITALPLFTWLIRSKTPITDRTAELMRQPRSFLMYRTRQVSPLTRVLTGG